MHLTYRNKEKNKEINLKKEAQLKYLLVSLNYKIFL